MCRKLEEMKASIKTQLCQSIYVVITEKVIPELQVGLVGLKEALNSKVDLGSSGLERK